MNYKVQILNRNTSDLDDSVHAQHIDMMISDWKKNSKAEVHQEFTFTENGSDKDRRAYQSVRYRNMSIIKQEDTFVVYSIIVPVTL